VNDKLRWTDIVKKDHEKPSFSHCNKKGHDEDHWWKLNPELKPNWARPQKGKKKTTSIVQDLGPDPDDEIKVTTMGIKGIFYVSSSSSCDSSSKDNVIPDERKINELFHIRVISKHTKIDRLVDDGLQVNIILEKVVKNLVLEIKPHLRSYPLGWVCEKVKL
jgi:hypothetical protein